MSAKALVLEIALIFLGAFFLWYKIFLPATFFATITFLVILLVVQILKDSSGKLLVLQLAILFLFVINIYYISTNYSSIPFWDGVWDYGVVKSFMSYGKISVIQATTHPANTLTWYSGWPLLHLIAVSLSAISGIDPYYIVMLLPSVIGISSFIFAYLLIEKIRKFLGLEAEVTFLALLIYAASPESVYWSMQFVRQNFGILFLTIIFYFISLLIINPRNAKYKALTIFFAMSLVMVHHFTSFIMVTYLFTFYALSVAGKYLVKTRVRSLIGEKLSGLPIGSSTIGGIALAAFAFLFIWWNNFGTTVWPIIGDSIHRFMYVLMGMKEVGYFPTKAFYPQIITPQWVSSLLLLRDLLMYGPSLFGLFLIITKASKTNIRLFVIYSTLAFGALFVLNYIFFKVETYRIVLLSLPFIALLSATAYNQLKKIVKPIWNFVIIVALTTFLLSSFVGLWAHNYAPMHIYDPSITPRMVGEKNFDFIRTEGFFSQRLSVDSFQRIWADEETPLLRLLSPLDYGKIRRLTNESKTTMKAGDFLCIFKNLNLYSYYSATFLNFNNTKDIEDLRYELYKYVEKEFNQIYNDGKYSFWTSK